MVPSEKELSYPEFDRLGGRAMIHKISKLFYDKVYKDAWLGLFFAEIEQSHIENQQTDFMTQALGGPHAYSGQFPIPAHRHMHITEELFELRHGLLLDSLKEAGASAELIEKWVRIEDAFKSKLIKNFDQCQKRYTTDTILSFQDPRAKFKRAA